MATTFATIVVLGVGLFPLFLLSLLSSLERLISRYTDFRFPREEKVKVNNFSGLRKFFSGRSS